MSIENNPLRHCVSGDTAEIVDKITGPFLFECLGKNDMAIVNGLIVSAAIMIVAHCDKTGDDVQEIADMFRNSFELALRVASGKAA